MFGEPGNVDKQRKVLLDLLGLLTRATEPGARVDLPYRWEAAPVMFRGKGLVEGSNS